MMMAGETKMDEVRQNSTTPEVRVQIASKNRLRTILHNPKVIIIAFFAS